MLARLWPIRKPDTNDTTERLAAQLLDVIAEHAEAQRVIATQNEVIAALRARLERLESVEVALGHLALCPAADDGDALVITARGDHRAVIVAAIVAARKAVEDGR